jgi:hypothetical protein
VFDGEHAPTAWAPVGLFFLLIPKKANKPLRNSKRKNVGETNDTRRSLSAGYYEEVSAAAWSHHAE